jgi:hypothetical protein
MESNEYDQLLILFNRSLRVDLGIKNQRWASKNLMARMKSIMGSISASISEFKKCSLGSMWMGADAGSCDQ